MSETRFGGEWAAMQSGSPEEMKLKEEQSLQENTDITTEQLGLEKLPPVEPTDKSPFLHKPKGVSPERWMQEQKFRKAKRKM